MIAIQVFYVPYKQPVPDTETLILDRLLPVIFGVAVNPEKDLVLELIAVKEDQEEPWVTFDLRLRVPKATCDGLRASLAEDVAQLSAA